MSIRHVFPLQTAALVISVTVGMTVSAANADSPTTAASARLPQQKQAAAACVPIHRPKHTIRRCGCTPSALAGVSSVDAAEILRLLTGDHGCRAPMTPPE
jgi:hypothetical protein